MKLSELIAFRNALDNILIPEIKREAELKLQNAVHYVQSQNVQIGDYLQQLNGQLQLINSNFDGFEQLVNQLKQDLETTIASVEPRWFQESYRLYDEEMVYETTDYILNRVMNIADETKAMFQARLNYYSSWQQPALVIRPGLETYVQSMVSHDPLYIVDQDYDLLSPTINSFPEEYQRRLRPKVIKERQPGPLLTAIPNEQMGLVFAYNFFNFRPLEIIKQYFEEVYTKLKPGGAFLLTINDCDNEKAVMLVESSFACYTPGSLIKELAKSTGYEVVFTWSDGGPNLWMELRRPGKLTSLRGGQTLAKILPKTLARSK